MGFTNSIISCGILTATTPNPITANFLAKTTNYNISYVEWLKFGFPPALIMTIFASWLIYLVYKPENAEIPGGINYIKDKLAQKGHMSISEWKTAIVFLIVVALWLTSGITNINTSISAIIGVCLLFVINVLEWKDVNNTPGFRFMMIMAGGFIIADLLLKTGAAKWLALTLFEMLNIQHAPIIIILLIIMLLIQYMHIPFMGTTKMTTMLLPVVISIAQVANINPFILAFPAGMLISGFPLFLFYNTISNLIIFGTGELKFSNFPKVGFPIATISIIVFTIMALTYWKWLGLYQLGL